MHMWIEGTPPAAAEAIARLERAGYGAHLVGGCVRDSLLGRIPGDWDITTAARPQEILAVFAGERCIPTGLRHGTVTLLLDGLPLEITTYRVDGPYLDGRHPQAVAFTSRLEEDLARRDFTVNAMAWSPTAGLTDPFGGREDLARGLLRAVGDPDTRFAEDGLRVLRGLRFAAQLGFSLEPATHKALLRHRDGLAGLSAERVLAEWRRLLAGQWAGDALTVGWPVAEQLLPPLAQLGETARPALIAAVDRLPREFSLRQAALLWGRGLSRQGAADWLSALRVEGDTRREILLLLGELEHPLPRTRGDCRRLLGRLGWETAHRLLLLGEALGRWPREEIAAAGEQLYRLWETGACCTLAQLAVKGGDLQGLVAPGREMGALLRRLLEEVLEGRLPNEREALLAQAARWVRGDAPADPTGEAERKEGRP